MTESVQFFFDPICPWAYQASKWIRDVRSQIDLDVDWRFFSLEEINREDGKKHPWERPWSFGWGQMRVGALIKRELGNEELDRWYAGIGESFFERGSPTHTPDAHRERIAELDFDPALVDRAIADESTTNDVRADHDHVTDAYAAFGVPTLVFSSERAVYGPVIAPAPVGEEALRLWEFTRQWSSFPQLYEMYTPKTRAAQAEIGAVFAPYLQARAWRTIQNPAP